MKDLVAIEDKLKQLLPELQACYGVSRVGIFGSYVRGEQTPSSDLDVLVDFSVVPSLLQFVSLKNYLAEQLGVRVDLVMSRTLKPRIGKRVMEEVVYL